MELHSYIIALGRGARYLAFAFLALFTLAGLVPEIGHALVSDPAAHAVVFGGGGVVTLAFALPVMRGVETPFLDYDTATPSEIPLNLTMLDEGIVIGWTGTHTPTADGTAVREIPVPISRIQIVADGNNVLHDILARDLVREQEIYEQTPRSVQVSGPSTITLAGGAKSFEGSVILSYKTLFADAAQANRFNMATWRFQTLTLRIEWADRSSIVRGGTGTITVSPFLDVISVAEDFSGAGDATVWGPKMPLSGRRFDTYALDATAETEWTRELSRKADLRSLFIITEDSNGDGTNGIVNKLSLRINETQYQFTRTNYRNLRARNSQKYGVAMPTGMAVFEFAEDQNLRDVFPTPVYGKVEVIVDRNAVAGTIRFVYNTLSGR